MSQSITNFKNGAMHYLQMAGEIGKGIGSRIVTLDRSKELYGDTNEAQLKGRSYMIAHELARVVLGTFIVAFVTYQCMVNPGGMNYFLLGTFSFTTLVALKEVAIQSIARQQEKENFNITEETQDTQYSLLEWWDDTNQNINFIFNDMHRSLTQLISESQKNDHSETVDSTETDKKD